MKQEQIYYLEMKTLAELNMREDSQGLVIRECEIKQYAVNQFLYQVVGKPWQWLDKTRWADAQWQSYAENEDLRTWIAYLKGSPVGYFELKQIDDHTVEIAYFGLIPRFIGLGYGGHLLSYAIQCAWQYPCCKRVIVNTCTLDHPNALANYQARGMKIYRTEPLTSA